MMDKNKLNSGMSIHIFFQITEKASTHISKPNKNNSIDLHEYVTAQSKALQTWQIQLQSHSKAPGNTKQDACTLTLKNIYVVKFGLKFRLKYLFSCQRLFVPSSQNIHLHRHLVLQTENKVFWSSCNTKIKCTYFSLELASGKYS